MSTTNQGLEAELQHNIDALQQCCEAPAAHHAINFMRVLVVENMALKQGQAPSEGSEQYIFDWPNIPPEVQFMAVDENLTACGWLVEPHIVGDAWRHQSHLSAYFYLQPREHNYRGDWKKSLEKRPLLYEGK